MFCYKKTAVVTGATGMLALALMRRLTAEGYYIYASARPGSPRIADIPVRENIKIIECDLRNIKALPCEISAECDEFYHFGWEGTAAGSRNDTELQIKNIQSSADAAYAAIKLGCKVFLGAGSQAEYGRADHKLAPDSPVFPESAYGMAKLCAGHMTRDICRRNGVKHIWCRIFSTYGPYVTEESMVMSGIIKMLNGERPQYTSGEQMWDYLYCDDAAKAVYLSAQNGKDGSIYCVGSGRPEKLRDYIYIIRDIIDPGLEIGIGEIPYGKDQIMYLCADTAQLEKDTGFFPEYTFEKGIAETVRWYKAEKKRRAVNEQ